MFEMNIVSVFFLGTAAVWLILGVALFSYLRWYELKRVARETQDRWKRFRQTTFMVCALLSPMIIPIIVTALCLYFDM